MKDLRRRIKNILYADTDVFQNVLEFSDFYGPVRDFNLAVETWERMLAVPDIPTENRIHAELAMIRVRRVRFGIELGAALTDLDRIEKHLNDNLVLRLEYRIVRAEFVLLKCSRHLDARRELECIADELRQTDYHFLYGLVANALSMCYLILSEKAWAEECFEICIGIFRRYENKLQYAYCLNNYAILKKKACDYSEAERLLRKSLRVFRSIGVLDGQAMCYHNLGNLAVRTGDWGNARCYFDKELRLRRDFASGTKALDRSFYPHAYVNAEKLSVQQRRFREAEEVLLRFVKGLGGTAAVLGVVDYELRRKALLMEFLAEMYFETRRFDAAQRQLVNARDIASGIAPESDLMAEILRRQSQLYMLTGEWEKARKEARDCIRLCRKISDKHEMSAALRVLGQVYAHEGQRRKAASTFEVGINILKSINECYELMRTCIAYSEFLINTENPDADMYLMEAKQLCKKLEIDFFMSKIMLLSSKYAHNNGDFMVARSHLKTAEEICENLQDCDHKQLMPEIKRFYETLEQSILQSSMKSAEKLKSLGKIYEDARFPIEELKPEMAMEVAKNVGAESLFLAKKKNKGFHVPLKYNIADTEAKQILRRRREEGIRELFTIKDPIVCPLGTGKTLVSVPSPTESGYVLCTVIDRGRSFTPRELEFLFASVEAMERVAEEYKRTPGAANVGDFMEESGGGLRHPGGAFESIITLDPEMIKIIRLAERASEANVPVLLEGETGVGKELFAQAIHSKSPRKNAQFVAINAGGVAMNLLESELFGHVKGAFTDAVTDRVGLIDEARGGTLFFDEVGEMCEELQIKLLRLLEGGEFRRLGENRLREADVRVISATNKDLQARVGEGKFREDLYYRLATVKFQIPPLRDRKRDIEFLVRHFLSEGLKLVGRPPRRVNVDMKALEAFEFYGWPGNIRELRNEIMRILSLIGNGDLIRFGMLSDRVKEAFKKRDDGGVLAARVERFERRLILKALEDNDWNRIRTAEQIGVPRTTLLFKMKRLNITA